jgi:TPR repeat protein
MSSRKCRFLPEPGSPVFRVWLFLTALFVVFSQQIAQAADFDAALKNYNRGDFQRAHAQFINLAKDGHAGARFFLGEIYEGGVSVAMDQQAAFKWYQKAAKQAHPNAQARLAAMYLAGRGVARNEKLAFHWYQSAAQLGEVIAQYRLAGLYASGTGTDTNLVNAYQWWTIAASYGDPDALHDRTSIEAKLSEKEILIAQSRARAWENEWEQSRTTREQPVPH